MTMSSTAAARRAHLEARLSRPDPGENRYEGDDPETRLDALAALARLARAGDLDREGPPGGINTHVHTGKSFSFFASPSEAAWSAWLAGIEIFGINDHYTLAGHAEFRDACELLGVLPLFSLEAVAMWREAYDRGQTVNDPHNPGRTYLTAKAVTRGFTPGGPAESALATMNRALRARNESITERLAALVEERLGIAGTPTFARVLRETPHDQPTERHIVLALAAELERAYPDRDARRGAIGRLTGAVPDDATLDDAARLQNELRAHLLKAGKPAYVEEAAAAFISVEEMVELTLDLGAIPTYPVLGNPVTPWEEDLGVLFDRLEALGIPAIEVIPDRNDRSRLRAILEAATARHFPVVGGTEHNTRSAAPLVDRYFFDEEFRAIFERGAELVLGHQELARRGEIGFVDGKGRIPGGDRGRRFADVAAVGRKLRSARGRSS